MSCHKAYNFEVRDEFSDLKLVFPENKAVYVDTGYLSHLSSYFAALRRRLFDLPKDDESGLPEEKIDIERGEFVTLLEVVYPSKKAIEASDVPSLLLLADRFLFEGLLSELEMFLMSPSSEEMDKLAKLEWAISYRMADLQAHILDSLNSLEKIKKMKKSEGYPNISMEAMTCLFEKLTQEDFPSKPRRRDFGELREQFTRMLQQSRELVGLQREVRQQREENSILRNRYRISSPEPRPDPEEQRIHVEDEEERRPRNGFPIRHVFEPPRNGVHFFRNPDEGYNRWNDNDRRPPGNGFDARRNQNGDNFGARPDPPRAEVPRNRGFAGFPERNGVDQPFVRNQNEGNQRWNDNQRRLDQTRDLRGFGRRPEGNEVGRNPRFAAPEGRRGDDAFEDARNNFGNGGRFGDGHYGNGGGYGFGGHIANRNNFGPGRDPNPRALEQNENANRLRYPFQPNPNRNRNQRGENQGRQGPGNRD